MKLAFGAWVVGVLITGAIALVVASETTRPSRSPEGCLRFDVRKIANAGSSPTYAWLDDAYLGRAVAGERIDVSPRPPRDTGSPARLLIMVDAPFGVDCLMVPVAAGGSTFEVHLGSVEGAFETTNAGPAPAPSTISTLAHRCMQLREPAGVFRTVVRTTGSSPGSAIDLVALKSDDRLIVVNSVGQSFVKIEPGTFQMGCATEMVPGESYRSVQISRAFWMQQTEVTKCQMLSVARADVVVGVAQVAEEIRDRLGAPDGDVAANFVSWNEASEMCARLSKTEARVYALPTEARWEYACRAGSQGTYHFGDSSSALPRYSWYGKNSGGRPHVVGTRAPNAWGLYDMTGNVREWCADWYVSPYVGGPTMVDPTGGSEHEAAMTAGKLFAPASRVIRGGMFNGIPAHDASGGRGMAAPDYKLDFIGFRIVLDR